MYLDPAMPRPPQPNTQLSTSTMTKQCFQVSPYGPLQLTEADRQNLMNTENQVVDDVFRKYQKYVEGNCCMNLRSWKLVDSKDDLHIYVRRTKPARSLTAQLCGLLSRRRVGPAAPAPAPAADDTTNTVVMSVGTFKGELDDLMLGTVNPTTEIMQVKASYVGDYDDGAVLATLMSPTTDDPFRSLTVKWYRINLPFSSTGVVSDRDFVCLEASGMLHFANGERVGYLMVQSVDSPQTQPLPDAVRAHHTITGFFRQVAPNVIDTFAFDTVDPGSKIFRPFVLSVCANALLSANRYVHCGQMKKLTWMLQRRQPAFQELSADRQPLRCGDTCVACAAEISPGTIGGIGRSKCQLCLGALCGGCKEHRTISFLSPDRSLLRHKTTFCTRCIRVASRVNAMHAARDQANGYQAYNVF